MTVKRVTRRQMLLASATLMLTGCATEQELANSPSPIWPDDVARPRPTGQAQIVPPGNPGPHQVQPRPNPAQPQPQPATAAAGPIRAIPRSSWAKADPIPSRLNKLGGVSAVTVHHEGWTPVYFEDTRSTADRLDGIRRSHIERMGAADIGYHYIIDRAGRVWQGRSVAYQGAHVKEHNENNIGIMVLGNFDQQQPTNAQVATLRSTLIALCKQYRLTTKKVYTHQELNKTECPGRVLQSQMTTLRRNGLA